MPFLLKFIYLAALGLSCGTRDLCCSTRTSLWLRCNGSRVRVLSCPEARGNLSSLTRDQTRVPCIGRWILNHRTTREVPCPFFYWVIFLLLSCESSSFYSRYKIFIRYAICKCFLPVCGLSFHSLNNIFHRAEF